MSNSVCYFCDETERLQEHHIVPRRFNGSDNEENLVDLCPTCHDKIEHLYNKRFYNELGVEYEKHNGIDSKCGHGDCMAPAEYAFESIEHRVEVCETHNECSFKRCTNEAVSVITNIKDGTEYPILICERHNNCTIDECAADAHSNVVSKEKTSYGTTHVEENRYCFDHYLETQT